MSKKPLSETNPYLCNPKQRAKMTRTHVISSTAIEEVYISYSHKKNDFVVKKSIKPTSHSH